MQQDFIEIQFPSDISYGSSGGVEYSTDIITTTTGCEFRTANIYTPRMYFNISTGVKNKQQIEKIITFFRICQGKKIGFRYKDWSDFKGINQGLKLISNNRYQIIKTYNLNDSMFVERIITKPVENTVKIYAQEKQLRNDQFSVDYTTGLITIHKNIKLDQTILACNFEFDIPVRFDTDYLPFTVEDNNLFSLPEIPIIEIKI